MRQFSSPGFRIWNLSREAKLVYTFFAVMALGAIASSVAFYEDLVGLRGAGVGAYYAGEPGEAPAAPPTRVNPAAGGPQIELPGEEAAALQAAPAAPARLTVAVTYRKLLEVTHFHLFTVPVFLLIVAHLFMLTGLAPGTKAAWIVGGFGSSIAHIAAPWLVRYGGAGFSWLYAASGAALGLTSTVLTLYPIWAMWMGRPGRGGSTSGEEEAQGTSGKRTPASR